MRSTGSSQASYLARDGYKNIILSMIRREREISRVELAQRMRMSRSAISGLVSELLEEGWVVESGEGQSIGGRRPILLTFNERARYLLGIEIGLSHLAAVVTDLRPRIICSLERPFDITAGPEVGLPAVLTAARAALLQARVDPENLVGMGVGLPSGLERWPGWGQASLTSTLRKGFKGPLLIKNSTDLAALGEFEYGAGRGMSSLGYIKAGTHLSQAVIRGGKPVRTGEFAHRKLDEGELQCVCGRRGCLETSASGEGLVQRASAAIEAGSPTQLRGIAAWRGGFTARDIAEAARMGDSLSQELFQEAGRALGAAVVDLALSHKLRRVIIGGGLLQSDNLLLAPLTKAIRQRLGEDPHFDIEPAALGRYSAALGAIARVCREVFAVPVEETAAFPAYYGQD